MDAFLGFGALQYLVELDDQGRQERHRHYCCSFQGLVIQEALIVVAFRLSLTVVGVPGGRVGAGIV